MLSKNKLFFLFFIYFIILVWGIDKGSLTSWDECLYANVSQHIYKTGNLIDLYYAGKKWADKPPLYMWITALFFKIFGINEFSVRLGSVIFGWGTLVLIYLMGKELFNENVGIVSSLFLLSTYHFLLIAKMGTLDSGLLFFTMLQIYSFLKLQKEFKFVHLFGLSLAGAIMMKGVGGFLGIMIIIGYALFSKEYKIFLRKQFLICTGIYLLPVIMWHFLAILHYGDFFVDNYFLKHLFTRVISCMEGHKGGWEFYLKVLFNKGRFWAPLGVISLVYIIKELIQSKEKRAYLLIIIWVSVVMIFFSTVKTKLHWYIIPIYPPLCLALAKLTDDVLQEINPPLIFLLSSMFILYLGLTKNIFYKDDNHYTKIFAQRCKSFIKDKEKIYLCEILDPGIQFYFFDFCKNINIKEIPLNKPPYILCESSNKKCLDFIRKEDYSLLLKCNDFLLFSKD